MIFPTVIPSRVQPAFGLDVSAAATWAIPASAAAYLELAQRLRRSLATIDPRLTRAANAASVPIFTP